MDGSCSDDGIRSLDCNPSGGVRAWQLDPADPSQVSPLLFLLPPSPIPRYGPETWGPWREVGAQYRNPRTPRILQLDGRHRVSGYSDKNSGLLYSIATKSLDGKEERVGEYMQDSSLREFDGSTLTLSHLSGDEEEYDWSVCFHYQ